MAVVEMQEGLAAGRGDYRDRLLLSSRLRQKADRTRQFVRVGQRALTSDAVAQAARTARSFFVVRGSFMEDDFEEEEDLEETYESNMYWVKQHDLIETINPEDIKEALNARLERVLSEL